MKEKLTAIPKPLQKQAAVRIGVGVGFLFLFLTTWLSTGDLLFCLPCFLLAAYLIINGGRMIYQGITEKYVCIEGTCVKVETTGIQKKIRSVTIAFDERILKLAVRQKPKQIEIGDTVILYLSDQTPVYEQENGYIICGYFAIEIVKGRSSG